MKHHSPLRVVILEDESAAAELLQTLLREIDATIEVLAVLDSVSSAAEWLSAHPQPDALFADIQLSDGISFDVFRLAPVECPIIFTTAFDEYALRAFKLNSIDYLLKPIALEELAESIEKLRKYGLSPQSAEPKAANEQHHILETLLAGLSRNEQMVYRLRFLIEQGDTLQMIPTDAVAYIYTANFLTYLVTHKGVKHVVDMRLDDIEAQLDPRLFFRANRQFIVNVNAITSIRHYFNRKLRLYLTPTTTDEVLVSREKASSFKAWLNR